MGLFNKLKKEKFNINNKVVILKYNRELDKVASFFVKILENLDKGENVIQENHTIRISYMFYKIIMKNNIYKLLVIDLNDSSFNTFTDDLSISFNYFLRQSDIINKTRTNNEVINTFFDDYMVISKRLYNNKQLLNDKKLYMIREELKEKDCGWYLGIVGEKPNPNNPDEYIKIRTYQLKDICDIAINVLQLPVGTLVIIDNNKIIDIVDKDNNKLI